EEYQKFLTKEYFAELKNVTNPGGETPLHRALRSHNIHLAKVLLSDNEVERTITNKDGKTAMDLLTELCQEDDNWVRIDKLIYIHVHVMLDYVVTKHQAKMWIEIKENPDPKPEVSPVLKTKYVRFETNLGEMRSTLTVVAALLATITFAAGFTLPGGLNQETGDAILAKKVPFLIFLLSDVYAMCTSMLVLFCLIWSMISNDSETEYMLVDRSLLILMQSLYGTMVAFTTAIFTVTFHSSLWAGITIFAMGSFIVISVKRSIMYKFLAKLPKANKDPIQILEEVISIIINLIVYVRLFIMIYQNNIEISVSGKSICF
ncbi:Ankyrin repeat-containing protein ITN1, partial [Bienertia sinuspersici]